MNITSFIILTLFTVFAVSGQSIPMHTCIVGGEVRLCSDLPVVAVASATTSTPADGNVKFERVNGGWVKTTTTVTPPSTPSAAPVSKSAPKPVAPRVRRNVAPPVPRPVAPQLTADDIRRAVTEGVRAAMPVAPATTAPSEPVTPTASMSSGLAQQVVDRLLVVEDGQRKLTGRVNEVSDRLTTAEGRLVDLRENQNADHSTIATIGAAAVTGSKGNRCTAYQRLLEQGMVNGNPPKGCK